MPSSSSTATGSITSAPRLRSSPSAPRNTVGDAGIERRRVVGLMQNAEARALQAVATQRRRVVRDRRDRGSRRSPDRSDPRPRSPAGPPRCLRPCASRRRRCRRRDAERHDTGAADEAHRGSQSDQRLVRGWTADRIAGVAGERDRAEVRAAAAAADPPLEPAVTRRVSHGLRV